MSIELPLQNTETFQALNSGALKPAIKLDGSIVGFNRKYVHWMNQLFDFSRRNRMINYRETKLTTLKITEPGYKELFSHLAVNDEELAFEQPVDTISDIRTFSALSLMEALGYPITVCTGDIKTERPLLEQKNTLKNMLSKSKLTKEEQGVNPLYLSFGFIEWRENNAFDAVWLKSPLIMAPALLKLKSIQAPFTLKRNDDGEIGVNPVLSYLFDKRYGIALPPFDLNGRKSIEQYMQSVEAAINKNGWRLTREVSLGLLSFHKISMYHDLDNNYGRAFRNPVVRAMTGDGSALKDMPGSLTNSDYDLVHPKECFNVVNSDSSQHEAIMLSKAGVSFVMQGPPGTGKSQTITNIIAEALAGGKKVLFVSGKAAALEVVYKRLSEARLEDFCLALHSHKANKKEIIDSIGASLKLNRTRVKESAMEELNGLFQSKLSLNQYARELHEKIPPLNKSLYEAFGVLASLNDVFYEPFTMENVVSVTAADYTNMKLRVIRLSEAMGKLGARFSENPLKGAPVWVFDEELSKPLKQNISGIENLHRALAGFQGKYGLTEETSWHYANRFMASLDLFEGLPVFPKTWICEDIRAKLLITAKERVCLQTRYRDRRLFIGGTFRDSVFDINMDEWIPAMHNALDIIRGVDKYANLSDTEMLNAVPSTLESLRAVVSDLENLVIAYYELEGKTGIVKTCTEKNVRALGFVCEMLVSSPLVQSGWCNKKGFRASISLLNDAEYRCARLMGARSDVLGQYREDILYIDPRAYLDRFSALYDSRMKRLLSGYESDSGVFRQLRKSGGGFGTDDVINLLIKLTKINRLRTEMNRNDFELLARFPDEYMGIETDWAAIGRLLDVLNGEIDMAQIMSNEINSARKAVQFYWKSGVFKIDADAVLLRFKTKYTNFLQTLHAGYREDFEVFKGCYKQNGGKLTNDIIINLLQDLISISEQEKNFSALTKNIARHFAGEFDGHRTNWRMLKTAFNKSVAQKNNISGISSEIISISDDILELWHEEALTLDPKETDKMLYRFKADYNDSFYESMRMYKEDIGMFAAMKLKDKEHLDDEEIIRVLRSINTINEIEYWFDDVAYDNLVGSFGDDYNGYDTEWGVISDKLGFVSSLFDALGCNALPQAICEIICDKTSREKELPEIMALLELLSIDTLQETMAAAQSFVPATQYSEIEDELLSGLYSLQSMFSDVNDKVRELQDCSFIGISNDSAIRYALEVESCEKLKREILSYASSDIALIGDRYAGIETDWDAIVTDINKISAFLETSEARLLTDGFIQSVCGDTEKRVEISGFRIMLRSSLRSLEKVFNTRLYGERAELSDMPLDKLSGVIAAYMRQISMHENRLLYLEAKALCDEAGLSDFTAKIEQLDNKVNDVAGFFERGFYSAWVESVIGKKKSVERFRRHVHDELIARFASMDANQLFIARERIRQQVIENMPEVNRIMTAKDELTILQNELRKRSRIMPLRMLFRSIPNLLLKLKPCLMMSPLSVAYFLESESFEFDLVIFDEASQIFPQDAIGAIFRGKQLIIAGDSKQLPPTNFFTTVTTDDEEDYDSESECGQGPEIFDSILEEAMGILPNKRLLWHYRSKHENLIAFSNNNFYDNELITFPSSLTSAPDSGVEFVYVKDGIYEGRGVNTREARLCVELVKAHIDKHPGRSLGIVAFSQSQQTVILNEIEKFREKYPKYESFFTEGKENEFFVKNLESVQGDERDTIIFSVSYAKTKEQRQKNRSMSLLFGPLGVQGGERRLNVAVSRARYNIKLVSSILPSDIDLRRTKSVGIRMLRAYIEFAINGSVALRAANPEGNDAFMDAVEKFIASRGYKTKKKVGCSEYKIDIAVIHPENDDCFAAGIECDGLLYASAKTARDRDHLRKSILEAMGWSIYRVWSAEWAANPAMEGRKLLDFIDNAISTGGVKADSTDSAKARARPDEFADSISEVRGLASVNNRGNPSNPYGFKRYVEAKWRDTPDIRNYSGAARIAEEIKYIVGIEQPIHINLLYQRMAGAFGSKTVTDPIKNYVDTVNAKMLKRDIVKDNDGFLTLAGFNDLTVRIPQPGSMARRIDLVPCEEISLAIITIAAQAVGVYADDLLDAAAKALGYEGNSESVKKFMKKGLDRLVNGGKLKIVDGKVKAPER